MTLYSAAILLFLVMDPLGNVPVFITVLKDVDPERRKRIIVREVIISLLVLLLFLFLGRFIMEALQLNEPSLSIAGGIILFLIALRMIFPSQEGMFGHASEREPFIVPLAIPLIAGPSAMASVLLLVTREPARIWTWMGALLCAWCVTAVILVASSYVSRALGSKGMTALERLMGMILTTISVQMLLNGIHQFITQP
jgi:multiple antibiotic resistance protein